MEYFIGSIIPWPNRYIPDGWLECNGYAYYVQQYPALYSIIGTRFGGNIGTTFNVPNLQGRIPIGAGNSPDTWGTELGDLTNTLSQNNMPAHAHGANVSGTCSGKISISATSTPGNTRQPDNNSYFAKAPNISSGINIYNNKSDITKDVKLPVGNISINGTIDGTITANINKTGATGNSLTIDNRQPYMMLRYIICALDGNYPLRP